MGGRDAQRGFIFQSIVAMIECLEREDWDEVKLEPETQLYKVDILLYKNDAILSAIQAKSSKNQFERYEVEMWLEKLKKDATDANEVYLSLVGDSYSPACIEFIKENPEIKTFPFNTLKMNCREKLKEFIAKEGLNNQVDDAELRVVYNNFFAEIHNNSISDSRFNRDELHELLKRVISIPKCLTTIPAINRNVGLIGREKELEDLRWKLDHEGCIALVSGLGGIGKTAVMRWICNSIIDDDNLGNHVAWINCSGSLQDDILYLRDAFGIPDSEDEKTAFNMILRKMRRLNGTLYLFMDNMSRNPDMEEMDILSSLRPKVRVMITSRHKIEDIPTIDLETLEHEPAVTMFYKYYGRDQEQRYLDTAGNIVETVHRHTLLVELLAKAAGKSGGTLEDFYEKLKAEGFIDVFQRPIRTKHAENLTIEESVIKLYEISGLSESQQRIMKLFTIFSPEKEIYYKVVEWAVLDSNAMDELVELAWLEQSGLENGYQIHQIIKDSLTRQMKNSGEELRLEEYGELISKVANTNAYMPRDLEYTKVKERLVLAEDVARNLEGRTKRLFEAGEYQEKNKQVLVSGARLFNNMAEVYDAQGEYEKALEYVGKALAIRERVLGTEHPNTATTYNNMALVYHAQGEYEKALEYYKKDLAISERVLGTEHPDTATTYNNMAEVYHAQGEYEKALEYYGKALIIDEQISGTEHPDTATTYNNMALVYHAQGEYEKALEYYDKALVIVERVLGSNHPYVASTYNNIAGVYRAQREYEKALEYYGNALAIRERVLGTEHPDIAQTYNNMALVYRAQGEYEKALEYYGKALAIWERVLGTEHPSTAMTYNNIACMYRDQGNYTKALELYEKALAVFKVKLGEDHPYTQDTRLSAMEIKGLLNL